MYKRQAPGDAAGRAHDELRNSHRTDEGDIAAQSGGVPRALKTAGDLSVQGVHGAGQPKDAETKEMPKPANCAAGIKAELA